MHLKEYLREKKTRLEDFARDIGYSVSYMQKVFGGSKCGRGCAYKVEIVTHGAVTAKEMLDLAKSKSVKNEILNPVREKS